MIWCLPSQITQQIAVGSGSGVFKSFLHILRLSGIHLLGQVCHLWGAPWILQDDQIVAVQTDGPLLFVLSKQVLHNVHVAQIPMMSGFGKQLCDSVICFTHQIIGDNQSTLVSLPLLYAGYAFRDCYSFQSVVTVLPFSITLDNILWKWSHHFRHMIQKLSHKICFPTSCCTSKDTSKGLLPTWIHPSV